MTDHPLSAVMTPYPWPNARKLEDAELRLRCLDLAVRMDAGDVVAAAGAFYDFVIGGTPDRDRAGEDVTAFLKAGEGGDIAGVSLAYPENASECPTQTSLKRRQEA